ncbi:MAG: hypothetical protein HY518_02190 [Candidatus Aenigmarchaeota archaeon]|nr:hypothetical protein [Candidatus Aenigmarchaeota archaeon]
MADFTKDGRIGCVEAIRPYHELKLTGREILDHLDTEAVARVVGYFRENEPEEFLIAVGREVLESGRYPTNRDVVRRAASRNPQIDISQVGAIAVFCIGYDGRSIEGENFLRSRKTNPTLEDRLISFVYPPAANDSSELERYAMETSEH